MGTGYTRNDSSNNIADGNVINASDLDGEFDSIVTAFSTSGHTHDGTAAEGGAITVMGPVQDFVVSATEIKPKTTNTLDIGTSLLQFKDIYIDGTAYLDTVDIDAGAIDGTTIGGTTPAAITATTLNATGGGSLTGTWSSLGTVTTVDINGGTIDGTTIGGSSAAAITGTTITGTSFVSSGNMTFGDNNKAIFGAGSDLQIYHDGSNSYIKDVGTGNLFVDAQDLRMRGSNGDVYATFIENGAVTLYYDNSAKLATTSTGIDVTGTVTADGLTVDDGTNGIIQIGSNSAQRIAGGTSYGGIRYYSASHHEFYNTSSQVKLKLDTNGDISFYDSTGTSQNLFWDASASALGIGTTSPTTALEVTSTTGIKAGRSGGASITITAGSTGEARIDTSIMSRAFQVNSGGSISLKATTGSGAGALNIDSSGLVGIGTASPSSLNVNYNNLVVGSGSGNEGITIYSGTSSYGGLIFADGTAGTAPYEGQLKYDHASNSMSFHTNGGSERMRIDGSGNVGIGNTSPTTQDPSANNLVVEDTAGNGGITIKSPTTAYGSLHFSDGTTGADRYRGILAYNHSENSMRFHTDSTERMRIDSSGNLLVGTTSTTPQAGGNTGVTVRSNGYLIVSTDGSVTRPMLVNRNTSDGEIVQFTKDGTTVGSIASKDGDMALGTGDTGLRFVDGSDAITPHDTSTNVGRGSAIDLGTTGSRFKDLYLSGGVFLGGTGAANKLDDVETGTFSPSITGWTGTYSNQDGIYTKVGDWVQVYGRVRTNASTGSFSDTYPGLSQLPFTSGVSVISAMGFGVWAAGTTSISSSQTCMVSFDSPNSGSNSAFPNWVVTGGNLSNFTNQHVLAGSAVELRFNCAYRTS